MIILDASSWVLALIDSGPTGSAARKVLAADRDWMAPAHTPIEVLRAIRRYEARDILDASAADQLAAEVIRAEVRLITPDTALLTYAWDRRHNVSPYVRRALPRTGCAPRGPAGHERPSPRTRG